MASFPLERIRKARGRNIGIIAKDKFVEDFEGELWEMGIENHLCRRIMIILNVPRKLVLVGITAI